MRMSEPIPAAPLAGDQAVAPAWHTIVVLLLLLAVSFVGARIRLPAIAGMHGRLPSYLFVLIFEWAAVAFIGWGVRRRGIRFGALIGGSWARRLYILRDLGLGIAFIVIFGGLTQVLTAVLKAAPPAAVSAMLPRTPLELGLWIPVAFTGGFCEEVIFRGYLQRQFSALAHSVAVGIVLQALVFGLSHGYQGWRLMLIIAIFGACFGGFAHWRRSLRPGIFGHVLQDSVGGILAYFSR
jgi:membrane protease YdiL (CAAX protease family)